MDGGLRRAQIVILQNLFWVEDFKDACWKDDALYEKKWERFGPRYDK